MYNDKIVHAIVQARMTSSRLPGKVLLPLIGKPVLQHIIERLRMSKYIDDVIIATTTNDTDQPIIDLCEKFECKYYRGSEDDVLQRVVDTANYFKTGIIIEVTADCPCIDSEIIDEMIETITDDINKIDYVSNVMDRTYPRGLDAQIFWTETLKRVNKEVDNPIDRQHVSTWIYKNPKTYRRFNLCNLYDCKDFSHIRLTLDKEEDYSLLKFVFEAFGNNKFNYEELKLLIEEMSEMFEINKEVIQKSYYKELSEWYLKNTKS